MTINQRTITNLRNEAINSGAKEILALFTLLAGGQ
jgi:hypothetical protein